MYLRSTIGLALCFKKSDLGLQGYMDADMARDVDGRKSTTGMFTPWEARQLVGFQSCKR